MPMSDNTQKICFVAVMIMLTGFASQSRNLSRGGEDTVFRGALEPKTPPRFVLVSPPPPPTPPPPLHDLSPQEKKVFNASTLLTAGLVPLLVPEGASSARTPPAPPPFLSAGEPSSRPLPTPPQREGEPEVQVRAAIVHDVGSGEASYIKNGDTRWPLASLTKLMVAVVALKEMDMAATATIHEDDVVVENARHDLKPGETFKIKDLLRAMLVGSSNEAAEAIARTYGRDNFVDLMNIQAKSWDLTNTHFDDPVGVSASSQSTVNDLRALVVRIFREYPEIFTITKEAHLFVTEQSKKLARSIGSTNAFAGRADFLGGKTGYTDEAEGNLVSLFSVLKKPTLVIVLGTSNRFGETETLLSWYKRIAR